MGTDARFTNGILLADHADAALLDITSTPVEMEEPAKAITRIDSHEDDSELQSLDSNRTSSESQELYTGPVFYDHQSSYDKTVPKKPYLTEFVSCDYDRFTWDWGDGRTARVSRKDPWNVAAMRSLSNRGERPSERNQIDIPPGKLKLEMLMGAGNKLGHRQWITPIQRIEALAPSCPERLPSLVVPPFAGKWPIPQQHSVIIGAPQSYLIPRHIASKFNGQSAPPQGGQTEVGNERWRHWRIRQMETFLKDWDWYWDHLSKQADKKEDKAVLETKTSGGEQPQEPQVPDIDRHTKSDATRNEDKDTNEGGSKGKDKEVDDRDEL